MEKRIYISIPISNLDRAKVREHADRVKHALSRRGWFPVSPFDIYAGANPDYADYITADLRALMDCDAVYFCRGWERSCGCQIEHAVVMNLKAYGRRQIEVHYED